MLYAVSLSEKGEGDNSPRFLKVGFTSNFKKRMDTYRISWDVNVIGVGHGGRDAERAILEILPPRPIKGKEYFDPSNESAKFFINNMFFSYGHLSELWTDAEHRIFNLNQNNFSRLADKVSDLQSHIEIVRDYIGGLTYGDATQISQVNVENRMMTHVEQINFAVKLFDGGWLEIATKGACTYDAGPLNTNYD